MNLFRADPWIRDNADEGYHGRLTAAYFGLTIPRAWPVWAVAVVALLLPWTPALRWGTTPASPLLGAFTTTPLMLVTALALLLVGGVLMRWDRWLGLGVIAARPLTAEEKLARLEARISNELGPAGARIVEENRR